MKCPTGGWPAVRTLEYSRAVIPALLFIKRLALALAQGCYDPVVDIRSLVAQIDEEIARLQQARSLLAGTAGQPRRGRPPGRSAKKTAGRPPLSPEARAKIA